LSFIVYPRKPSKMQARNTLLSFILIISALAGLASAAPSPTADTSASTPATQEKEATPAAASGSSENVAEKHGPSGQTADAHATAGDKAEQAAQPIGQNAAVFATSPADGGAETSLHGPSGLEKRDDHDTAPTPHSDAGKTDAAPQTASQLNAASNPSQTTDGTDQSPHAVVQAKRHEHAEPNAAADDASAPGTPTHQDAQHLKAITTSSVPEPGNIVTDPPHPHN
ncbi:hypothetical protein MJO29_014030, partial [Puccinia striiformis f. sp. tritici]